MHVIASIKQIILGGFLLTTSIISAGGQTVIGASAGKALIQNSSNGISMPGSKHSTWLSGIASAFPRQGPLAQWGPISVRPHLAYELLYGNGILRAPGEPTNSTLQIISPGLTFDVGNYSTLEYTLSHQIYSSRLLSDKTNHNARLQTGMSKNDWTFGLVAAYGINTSTLVETGGQTNEDTRLLEGSINYPFGRRSSLNVILRRSQRLANPLERTTAWTGSDWINTSASAGLRYSLTQKVTVGVGIDIGYDEVSDNPDMTYAQPKLQITWRPTDRISLEADGGVEWRRTHISGSQDQENTIYNVSGRYHPFRATTLAVGANRTIATAYFVDQTTQSTSWRLSLEQRLLRKVYLSMGYGHGGTVYVPTYNRSFTPRDDRYDSIDFRVSIPILQRGSISFSYRRSQNNSTQELYNYTSNQAGTELSYRY